MGKSGLFSVSGSNGTRGAIISVSGTRGWAVRAATISVSGRFWRQNFEASRLCMQMAAEAWPVGRIGILSQTKECLLERGRVSVRSCNCTHFVIHPVWWPAKPSMGVRHLVSIIWRFCQLLAKGVQICELNCQAKTRKFKCMSNA